MKKLSKKHPFYQTVLNHFKKQYKDVKEITLLKVTTDNKICAGEWIDSNNQLCVSDSVDSFKSIVISE
jgi:hypothetical protein